MKRIPFTIEAWKAGGVPVTRSGEYVKQLTWFNEAKSVDYPIYGVVDTVLRIWDVSGVYNISVKEHCYDLFLEVPFKKYYTHYYRHFNGVVNSVTNQNSEPTGKSEFHAHIKTVEVEL